MTRVRTWFLIWAIGLCLAVPAGLGAQEGYEILPEEGTAVGDEDFFRGEVTEILEEREEELGLGGNVSRLQRVKVRLKDGPQAGQEVEIEYGSLSEFQRMEPGTEVIVIAPQPAELFIFDRYRLAAIGGIILFFVLLVAVLAGWKGLGALTGLAVSMAVIVFYAVPQIMAGQNPFLVSLVAAGVISVGSVYLAHGFSRRTTVAMGGILATVVLALGLAQLFVRLASLTGTGSEEAFFLQTSPAAFVNLRGLLLGGIIIGVMGVLDDIATAQAAAVDEIWQANPRLSRRELYRRGMSVGREHIASLINTLALAYVGASFPALLLFTVYERPWWVVANSETIAEEVVRTLVGSAALMVAVPITTWLAAYWLPKGKAAPAKRLGLQ